MTVSDLIASTLSVAVSGDPGELRYCSTSLKHFSLIAAFVNVLLCLTVTTALRNLASQRVSVPLMVLKEIISANFPPVLLAGSDTVSRLSRGSSFWRNAGGDFTAGPLISYLLDRPRAIGRDGSGRL